MKHPFKQGEFYFATDGIALIQIPTSVIDMPIEANPIAPNAISVMPTDLHAPVLIDVSKLSRLIEEVVEMVPVQIECEICDGAGTIECNLGHEHDCEECSGRGTWDHDTKKERDPDQVLVIDSVPLRVALLQRLIVAATALQVSTVSKIFGKSERVCLFSVGDARIILMSSTATPTDDRKYITVDISKIQ